ncbi:hypothetical protein CPB83DRAFT_373322 [Crepidotus variabilis]|uniref:Uncharacterized protein n=1 Tax=Crepidotus variabilis TaxID=179855 RepID=A0A9P6JNZ7_9AGAR|nr:hypothetical protein CPB83DRAFT_373322 [Crepidotus variabilis]
MLILCSYAFVFSHGLSVSLLSECSHVCSQLACILVAFIIPPYVRICSLYCALSTHNDTRSLIERTLFNLHLSSSNLCCSHLPHHLSSLVVAFSLRFAYWLSKIDYFGTTLVSC